MGEGSEPVHPADEKTPILNSEPLYPEEKPPTLTKCQIFVFLLGLLTILFATSMLCGGYKALFNNFLQKELEVANGSVSYDMWKAPPFPLILNLYIWNITNPEEFVKGATPDLEECGPYVWREYHEKKNVSFHDNATVSYFQQRWWIWDEELSGNNSLEDSIYTLNPIPISAAWSVRSHPFYIAVMNEAFNSVNETVVVNATVNEVIFEGFEDPVLEWVQKNIIAENGTYHFILPFLDLPASVVNFDKFAWFYMRNNSVSFDGYFNMMTGTDDISNVGKIDWWDYSRKTDFFDAPCNHVTGSAGEFFEPGLQRDKLVLYSSDICMSMSLFYKEDITRNGVKAYRFWGSNHTLANGSVVPGNECYCVKGTCAPMGLINAESCRMGAPAFVSFPHFFNADPFLLNQVNGLDPNEEKHSFIMDVMPETGVPINVKARMQINMRLKPYPGEGLINKNRIDILKEVPDVYLPMIWFEEFAAVPSNMSKPLITLQFIMSTPTVTICFSLLLVIGLGMLAYIAYAVYRAKYQPEESFDDRFPSSI